MNKRIANKWANALESGKYKQAKNVMSNCEGGYCCLGVLSDIYAKEKKVGFEDLFKDFIDDYVDYETDDLPERVANWAGFSQNDSQSVNRFKKIKGKISSLLKDIAENHFDNGAYSNNNLLARFNDNNVPFKSIAKFIRANWKEL